MSIGKLSRVFGSHFYENKNPGAGGHPSLSVGSGQTGDTTARVVNHSSPGISIIATRSAEPPVPDEHGRIQFIPHRVKIFYLRGQPTGEALEKRLQDERDRGSKNGVKSSPLGQILGNPGIEYSFEEIPVDIPDTQHKTDFQFAIAFDEFGNPVALKAHDSTFSIASHGGKEGTLERRFDRNKDFFVPTNSGKPSGKRQNPVKLNVPIKGKYLGVEFEIEGFAPDGQVQWHKPKTDAEVSAPNSVTSAAVSSMQSNDDRSRIMGIRASNSIPTDQAIARDNVQSQQSRASGRRSNEVVIQEMLETEKEISSDKPIKLLALEESIQPRQAWRDDKGNIRIRKEIFINNGTKRVYDISIQNGEYIRSVTHCKQDEGEEGPAVVSSYSQIVISNDQPLYSSTQELEIYDWKKHLRNGSINTEKHFATGTSEEEQIQWVDGAEQQSTRKITHANGDSIIITKTTSASFQNVVSNVVISVNGQRYVFSSNQLGKDKNAKLSVDNLLVTNEKRSYFYNKLGSKQTIFLIPYGFSSQFQPTSKEKNHIVTSFYYPLSDKSLSDLSSSQTPKSSPHSFVFDAPAREGAESLLGLASALTKYAHVINIDPGGKTFSVTPSVSLDRERKPLRGVRGEPMKLSIPGKLGHIELTLGITSLDMKLVDTPIESESLESFISEPDPLLGLETVGDSSLSKITNSSQAEN